MKPTIARTLEALAGAGSGAVGGLPLSVLYRPECVERAGEAFQEFCSVGLADDDGTAVLSVTVHTEHRAEGSRIVGEFLNHLLALSMHDLRPADPP